MSNLPTKRELRTILYHSLFNPREPKGIIKIILNNKNPSYFEYRAEELIKEARLIVEETPNKETNHIEQYENKISMAISLLAYAVFLRKGR